MTRRGSCSNLLNHSIPILPPHWLKPLTTYLSWQRVCAKGDRSLRCYTTCIWTLSWEYSSTLARKKEWNFWNWNTAYLAQLQNLEKRQSARISWTGVAMLTTYYYSLTTKKVYVQVCSYSMKHFPDTDYPSMRRKRKRWFLIKSTRTGNIRFLYHD